MAILPESSQITSVTTTPSMIALTELQIGRKRLSKIIRMIRENMFTPERYNIYFTNLLILLKTMTRNDYWIIDRPMDKKILIDACSWMRGICTKKSDLYLK